VAAGGAAAIVAGVSDEQVRQATPHDRDRVIATVVAAFVDDPAFGYFFDAEQYANDAAAFAGWLFDRRVPHGTIWVVDGGSAVSMWEPPHPPGANSHAAQPAEPGPAIGAPAAQRLASYDRSVHRLLPTQPHWYLGVLATHPEHAGKRWGRAVMQAGLVRAAAGVPACLETTNPANVALYQRSGWSTPRQGPGARASPSGRPARRAGDGSGRAPGSGRMWRR
jgi:GNAT superfamily N-acetyltransferase